MNYEETKHKINKLWNDNIKIESDIIKNNENILNNTNNLIFDYKLDYKKLQSFESDWYRLKTYEITPVFTDPYYTDYFHYFSLNINNFPLKFLPYLYHNIIYKCGEYSLGEIENQADFATLKNTIYIYKSDTNIEDNIFNEIYNIKLLMGITTTNFDSTKYEYDIYVKYLVRLTTPFEAT